MTEPVNPEPVDPDLDGTDLGDDDPEAAGNGSLEEEDLDLEAPEADVAEQQRVVRIDEDEYRE
ncbi:MULTISPECIES: hypothetical protein [Streptacidiphilus]|uniref:Uncharacterized protein n=2 Tax=Streptacidiphilus TaxID=228398 RepID=A0ABV6V0F8_9ACTN|nr:hypothetical protein [Streptacidiphilus jeojiense]